MDRRVLYAAALARIQGIHQLSSVLNGPGGAGHRKKLFELIRNHADEIEALSAAGDPHYLTETGDLLILCFEVLLEGGSDPEDVIRRCFERYEKKLTGLLQARHPGDVSAAGKAGEGDGNDQE